MFAIAFDMDIKELRSTYGEPYNNAYYEIKILLRKYDFYNTQGSVYLTDKDDMANLFAAIVYFWTFGIIQIPNLLLQ